MITNDPISLNKEAHHIIQQNFDVFHRLVAQARDFAERGEYDMAAIYGDVAAKYAFRGHCGLFVSPELEQVMLMLGRNPIKNNDYPNKTTHSCVKPKHVLHVVTAVWDIGGHSRLVWRWIHQDTGRSHSVVLTTQSMAGEVPKILRDTVLDSQGKIYILEEIIGSMVSRAKQLRQIATSADVVVLHTMDDIIPIIAFANKEQSPPVIFVNHADERIWLGVCISDVVANLRESGMRLSEERRGIEPERNALLPTILSPICRTFTRIEAKQKLGLPNESIVLLSIARSDKYKTIDGINFADAHIPLLKQYDRAVLLVIGPGDSEDWSAAVRQTHGRIQVFGHTEDTKIFYQAADIYVDSFPWVSNTSLLEAGSYGTPLVTRYPYSSDVCEIFGADMPGLSGNLIRVRNLDEYTAVLSRLIEDEDFRLSLGKATRSKIVETHIGSSWQHSLEEIYSRAATMSRITVPSNARDQMVLSELDILFPTVFSHVFKQEDVDLDNMIHYARLMPLAQRFRIWTRLIKKRDFGSMARISHLLPYWLYWRLQKLYLRLQKFD